MRTTHASLQFGKFDLTASLLKHSISSYRHFKSWKSKYCLALMNLLLTQVNKKRSPKDI